MQNSAERKCDAADRRYFAINYAPRREWRRHG